MVDAPEWSGDVAVDEGVTARQVRRGAAALVCRVGVDGAGDAAPRGLARFLRLLVDASAHGGGPLPVVAVLEAASDADARAAEAWSAQQDWHRGDFAVVITRDDRSTAEAERAHLATGAGVWRSGLLLRRGSRQGLAASVELAEVPASAEALRGACVAEIRGEEGQVAAWLEGCLVDAATGEEA